MSYLGASSPSAFYKGSTAVAAVYQGSALIWTASVPKLLILLEMGNSHMDGRATALAGDVYPSISRQFTDDTPVTNGVITTISGAVLSNGDLATPANGIGPMMQANIDLAATGEWAQILNVQVGEGASGFADGRWDATTAAGAGNNLTKAAAKLNAAYNAAVAAGWTNIEVMVVWLNSKPDLDNNGTGGATLGANSITYGENYVNAAMAAHDYLVANCPCMALLTASTWNCAVTDSQINSISVNCYSIASAMNGLRYQRPKFGRVDVIFPWGSAWDAGLPVVPFDGTHATRDGEITKGHLIADALLAARTNNDPWADWKTLSFWADISSLYDFRTGRGKDWKGTANLIQEGNAPPLLQRDDRNRFGNRGLVWRKQSSSTSGRVWKRTTALPASYTLFTRLTWDAIGPTGIFGNINDGTTALRQAFFYSVSNGGLTVGNAGTQVTRAWTPVANAVYDIALTFDAATSIMKVYVDGAQLGADITGQPATSSSTNLYLGANSGGSTPPQQLIGAMPFFGIVPRALTASEVAEIHTKL